MPKGSFVQGIKLLAFHARALMIVEECLDYSQAFSFPGLIYIPTRSTLFLPYGVEYFKKVIHHRASHRKPTISQADRCR
jgi:hypothetical protein